MAAFCEDENSFHKISQRSLPYRYVATFGRWQNLTVTPDEKKGGGATHVICLSFQCAMRVDEKE
jgi:hypothetical protein